MRVTTPVDITQAKLISSTVSDIHDPSAYAAGTTYAFGAIVKVVADYKIYESIEPSNLGNTPNLSPLFWRVLGPTETAYSAATTYPLGATCSNVRRCYESLQAGNIGHTPPVYPEKETEWWMDVGPTNKWAMFDLDRNTQTVCASPLTVVLAPGQRVNTVGSTGMRANSIQVGATSVTGGGTVYPSAYSESSTGIFNLNSRIVRNAYDYAFTPFTTIPSNVIFDIPPFFDIRITITMTATSGNVKCGGIVVGNSVYLGEVESGISADSLNFSKVTRDDYGNATLVRRKSLPKVDLKLRIPKGLVNKAKEAKEALDATPALWTGMHQATSDWFELLQIMGIYTKFSFADHADINSGAINLSIEEI